MSDLGFLYACLRGEGAVTTGDIKHLLVLETGAPAVSSQFPP